MRSIERYIYNLVRFHPGLKNLLKNLYQGLFTLLPTRSLNTKYNLLILDNYFYGFHDKCPWSPDNTKLLAHKYTNPLKMPTADDEIQVGYFTVPDYDLFHQIGTTKTWNWQMGSMLQWMGNTNNIIFNDFDGKYHHARAIDVEGEEHKRFNRPVAALSSDGNWALSHSFVRLRRYARAYCYPNGDEATVGDPFPADDGLYLMNLNDGEIKLLFSIKELSSFRLKKNMAECYHYFTHPLFSPNGQRFIFFHRWVENNGQTWTRMFSCNRGGSDLYLFKTSGVVTHVSWKDNNTILSYAYKKEAGDHYYLFKDKSDQFEILGKQYFSSDGHPQFSPDRKYLITDTYPDRNRIQRLIRFNMQDNYSEDLAHIRSPLKYRGDVRCDLHPRWNRNGSAICFDSAHSGKRALCIINLD